MDMKETVLFNIFLACENPSNPLPTANTLSISLPE